MSNPAVHGTLEQSDKQTNWQVVKLGEILVKSSELIAINPDEQYQQITVRLWGRGVVQRARVSGAQIASDRQFVVRRDQFILSRIDARNGAFGLIPDWLDGAVVSNDFPTFTLDTSRIIPAFLGWMSRTESFINLCKEASEGTTNRVRLQEGRFLAGEIPLPPLDEQRRIVARINELAAKIEEAHSLYKGVQADLRKVLLSAYAEIVQEAEPMPMREVAPLERRPIEVEPEKDYYELGIRSFGKGAFHKPSISGAALGTKKIFQIKPGDLLFNIVFAWEGAVAVARPEDEGRVGSHRFLTCVPKDKLATSAFLFFHFLTEQGLQQLGEASPGGAGRNRTLGLKALEEIVVPIPSLEKQIWFDSLQAKADMIKRLQAKSAAELDALLPAVLDQAFRGEL